MLTHLFQQFLIISDYTGDITITMENSPIYKSGKKSDPQNYRPIPILTSDLPILTSHIMQHLEEHNILLPSQFGQSIFVSHSCLLLQMTLQRP